MSSFKHPEHYNSGKIEVWDFIIDQELNFIEGNIVKYTCRYKSKNKTARKQLEDIEKIIQYAEKLKKSFINENKEELENEIE